MRSDQFRNDTNCTGISYQAMPTPGKTSLWKESRDWLSSTGRLALLMSQALIREDDGLGEPPQIDYRAAMVLKLVWRLGVLASLDTAIRLLGFCMESR